ncbi:MAG: PA2779 family protein [Alphaproteobacteria bacterium]|nr:PA2779 family protein [Alphaproteobacteria bacterium]
MCIFRHFSAPVACLLVAVMVWVSLPHRAAFAGLVGTETVLSGEAGALDDRARVRNFMLRQDVQAKVASYGVDPVEAVARIDGLSDAEVMAMAARIDNLPEGQSGGISNGDATILVVAILVVLGAIIMGVVGLFTG